MKIRKLLILVVATLTMLSAVPVMADSDSDKDQLTYTTYEKEKLSSFIREADEYSYANGIYTFDKTVTEGTDTVKEVLSLVLLDSTKKVVVDNNIGSLRRAPQGTGGNTFSDWDISGSIYASISITYTTSYIGNTQYALLKNVSVSRSANYNGVSPSSQYVTYGCWGRPYQGSASGQSVTVPLASNTTSWSVNTPASWLAVSMAADHTIGGTYTLYLKRGLSSSTWALSVDCHV